MGPPDPSAAAIGQAIGQAIAYGLAFVVPVVALWLAWSSRSAWRRRGAPGRAWAWAFLVDAWVLLLLGLLAALVLLLGAVVFALLWDASHGGLRALVSDLGELRHEPFTPATLLAVALAAAPVLAALLAVPYQRWWRRSRWRATPGGLHVGLGRPTALSGRPAAARARRRLARR
ncbi:MAG TPA: hypothetical protein VFC93_03245 [Chloroflexota bacterium]|nr:hypothetical protein [Chloroflexota bacterium]